MSVARVERETVVAWDSGAQPVVLLTKVDQVAQALSKAARRLFRDRAGRQER